MTHRPARRRRRKHWGTASGGLPARRAQRSLGTACRWSSSSLCLFFKRACARCVSSVEFTLRHVSGGGAFAGGLAGRRSSSTSAVGARGAQLPSRSEEHTSELQSLLRISYAVFC